VSMRSRIAATIFAVACATAASAQGTLVDVVEFYNATLDHYFISSLPADIAALDSGTLKGWARTGQVFKAYDAPAAGTSPVCRFYLPPASGDSHFYSASPVECAEVAAKFPAFSYESQSVMHVGLPDAATGACSPGWAPVYRLWNQRADSNHRYTTDRGLRSQMLAQGYVAEGYGPEGVAMCSPGANGTFDLSLTTPELLLMPGDVREVYVIVAPASGFTGDVALSVSGMPAGIAGQLSASTLSVGPKTWAAKLRLTASGSAATAAGAVTVVAQSADTSASTTLAIAITQPGDPVAVRLRAIADVEDRSRELVLQGMDVGSRVQAIAAFMTAHPQYEEAGFDLETGTAWGRQRDGTLHVFSGNRAPALAAAAKTPASPMPKSSDVETTVPRAFLAQSHLGFGGSAGAVAQMRQYLSGKGWQVETPGAGVKALMAAKNVGFLYLDGDSGWGKPKGEPGVRLYSIRTDTLVTPSREVEFDADRTLGRLAQYTGDSGFRAMVDGPIGPVEISIEDTRYAITERFVNAYMSFQPDSVVWINASFSNYTGSYYSSSASFIQAFHNKNAAVYLGWDYSVLSDGQLRESYKSATYFVDRMVGANLHPVKENPPQRPFPYDLVLSDMRGKLLDRADVARLVASTKAGLANRPIFAPSIRYVTVDEAEGLLTLTGEFGSPTPKVTVGGTELGLKQWFNSQIVAYLPFSGKGSNGDVLVEVNGVRSNARQLSDWTILLNYLWHQGADVLQLEGHGQVRFRADVAGYRLTPAETPRQPVRGGPVHRDSVFEVTASGSYTEQGCTATASGSQTYYSPLRKDTLLFGDVLSGTMRVDADRRDGDLALLLATFNILTDVRYTGKCSAVATPFVPTFGLLDGLASIPTSQSDNPSYETLPAMLLLFSSKFDIAGDSRKFAPFPGATDKDMIRVSWPSATPVSPPRDTPDSGK
jgi:hypothetical protein